MTGSGGHPRIDDAPAITAENATIAFSAGLSGTNFFRRVPREASKPRSRPPSIGTFIVQLVAGPATIPQNRALTHTAGQASDRLLFRRVSTRTFHRSTCGTQPLARGHRAGRRGGVGARKSRSRHMTPSTDKSRCDLNRVHALTGPVMSWARRRAIRRSYPEMQPSRPKMQPSHFRPFA